jgi:hypothetical protein
MKKNQKPYQFELYPTEDNTSKTTGAIIYYLNNNGWFVWRNNTYGVWDRQKAHYRALQFQQKGVADVIGFRKSDSLFIAIEIKTNTDAPSREQLGFLDEVKKSNGFAMIAKNFEDFLEKYESRFSRNLLPKQIIQ